MSRPLYCDESVWSPVVDGLRGRGWDVHAAREHDRLGVSDAEHIAFALENDWLLFTFDDVLSLVEREGLEHAGVVYTDQAGMRVGDVVKALDAYLDDLDAEWRGIHFL